MGQLVRAEKTHLVLADVHAAIRAAITPPMDRPGRIILLAQIWLETGNGEASYGWNLGGIKHTPADPHDWYEVQTEEDDPNGTKHIVVQPFRSYANMDDAAADYVGLVQKHYPESWDAAMRGDVTTYATWLKNRGYFTAPAERYLAALLSRRALVESQLGPDTSPDLQAVAQAGIEQAATEADGGHDDEPPDAA